MLMTNRCCIELPRLFAHSGRNEKKEREYKCPPEAHFGMCLPDCLPLDMLRSSLSVSLYTADRLLAPVCSRLLGGNLKHRGSGAI